MKSDEHHSRDSVFKKLNLNHTRPIVQTTNNQWYCTKAVDRLKAGPENIPKVICDGANYTDSTFDGVE